MIAKILHIPTTFVLIGIAVIFSFVIVKNLYILAVTTFSHDISLHDILEKSFQLILFIEVIASIKIYFQQNYHFPLRFFLYIGMTDLIRHIIINRDNPQEVLIVTLGLLILIIGLSILEYKNFYLSTKKQQHEESHFEL